MALPEKYRKNRKRLRPDVARFGEPFYLQPP